jgi:hypothetical protein
MTLTPRLLSRGLVLSFVVPAAIAVSASACGGSSKSSGVDASTATKVCIPGAQIACTCVGGGIGAQICAADGQSLGACQGCSSTSDSGSGDGTDSGNGGNGDAGDGAATTPDAGNGSPDAGDAGGGQPSDGGIGDASDGGLSTDAGDSGLVCNPNPLNYDVLGNGCDDDGDGIIDNLIICDTTLPTGPSQGTATQLLNAMEVCHAADATHWGIVSASFTNSHATANAGNGNFNYQHGILHALGGVTPQQGASLGVLSSGTADATDSQDNPPYFKGVKTGMQSTMNGDVPTGFPKANAGCALSKNVNDVINLKTQIKVPANAQGISFDFSFASSEWPEYVCTDFNDSFIAYMQSSAWNGGTSGNIAFDAMGNPMSVNVGFLSECSPAGAATGCNGTVMGTAACANGAGALTGSGFDDLGMWCNGQSSSGGGATGWLRTTAPVRAGETISLEFIIWDTGDAQYDSSVVLDHLTWLPSAPAAAVTAPSP